MILIIRVHLYVTVIFFICVTVIVGIGELQSTVCYDIAFTSVCFLSLSLLLSGSGKDNHQKPLF